MGLNDILQFISYEVELQIPHSVCAEVQTESVL